MNQKQLANVLVKILGLSLCAHSFTTVAGALASLPFILAGGGARSLAPYITSIGYGLVPLGIGLWLILGAKWFVDLLFKDE